MRAFLPAGYRMSVVASIPPQLRNLKRLVALRLIEVLAQMAVIVVASYVVGMALPTAVMFTLSGLLGLVTLLSWWRTRQPWPVSDAELSVHLLFDIGILTALLYFAGGATNPFVTLFLIPLSIAAALLPARHVWSIVVATVACYVMLLNDYVPLPQGAGSMSLIATLLPEGMFGAHDAHGVHAEFGLHVLGMGLNFAISAVLIAWFVAHMAQSIRERDRRLAEAREQALRNEQLIALGTLAAGAAHELSTPLATMQVLAGELVREHAADAKLREDLQLLRTQAEQCKNILTRLSADAGVARAEQLQLIDVIEYFDGLLERWQLLRPQVQYTKEYSGDKSTQLLAEPALDQALLNLLNNAADASDAPVEISAQWDAKQLQLEIRDRGPGISDEVAARAGEAFFTTKGPGRGLGIGLFLANASIERAGGTVQLFNREGGGACVRVLLPLNK